MATWTNTTRSGQVSGVEGTPFGVWLWFTYTDANAIQWTQQNRSSAGTFTNLTRQSFFDTWESRLTWAEETRTWAGTASSWTLTTKN